MEAVRNKIFNQIQHMLDHAIIKDRRFLDDEQLIRAEQMAVLEEIFNDHLSAYQSDPASAHALLEVGNAPIAKGEDEPSLAAWTSVARVLLNLHETTQRN